LQRWQGKIQKDEFTSILMNPNIHKKFLTVEFERFEFLKSSFRLFKQPRFMKLIEISQETPNIFETRNKKNQSEKELFFHVFERALFFFLSKFAKTNRDKSGVLFQLGRKKQIK